MNNNFNINNNNDKIFNSNSDNRNNNTSDNIDRHNKLQFRPKNHNL